jgi:hypothetical protein
MFASIKDTALPTGSGIFPDGAVKPFHGRADEQKLQANVHFTLNCRNAKSSRSAKAVYKSPIVRLRDSYLGFYDFGAESAAAL